MEKVIRDGKVAVLISHGYGAGWFSWNSNNPEILFHPKLVEMVEQEKTDEITDEWCLEHLGLDIYTGGAKDLTIYWLKIGTAFKVEEYDGNETLITMDDLINVA